MKRFACPTCGEEVHFRNNSCVHCATTLAFLPEPQSFTPAPPAILCRNAKTALCNWAADPVSGYCRACQHNRTVPDAAEHGEPWAKIEQAKRRLFYSLIRWNLPTPVDGPQALAFDFLADSKDKKVLTGHADGLITLNVAEGDDATREARRTAMGEPYRTLIGHMRHEVAHYYWQVLVHNSNRLEECRALFGDDRADYQQALKTHYANGPRPDWEQSFVSAYAASHPWEDFAETFAHWLHMVDGLDTAMAYGIGGGAPFDPYGAPDAQAVVDAFVPVSIAINAVNRALGQPDLYPFVLNAPVIDKMQFIHSLIAPFRVVSGGFM